MQRASGLDATFPDTARGVVGRCDDGHAAHILAIVNAAAEAYRGIIPQDRWHDPYMSDGELAAEIAAGVAFWGFWRADTLVGVMGVQPVRDVDLIRHAYVSPDSQGRGIGRALLRHILLGTQRRVLVGTWKAASWAIAFYEGQGFGLVSRASAAALLTTYWSIPDRQVETSVVLEYGRSPLAQEHRP